MRVLVTGAAGFIGSHVAERLIADGHEVTGIDDLSTGDLANLADASNVRLVQGSILDPDELGDAIAAADAVVHLAARPSVPRSIENPVASHEANATGTLRVLEAARAVGDVHVITASSSSVYGANPTLPKHEGLVPQPMSPYAVSKLATEQYTLAWQHSYGMRTLAFRFFNVYGPRQPPGHAYAAVVPAFLDAALMGRPLTVHGDGTHARDFTYVGTVTEVISKAISSGLASDSPINLAFGTCTSLLQLIALIEDVLDRQLERNYVQVRPGDVPYSQASPDRLRELVGDVAPTPLDVGLRATIDWFRSLPSGDARR